MTYVPVAEADETTILDALETLSGRPRRDNRAEAVRYPGRRGLIIVDERAREIYSYGRHFPLCRFVPGRINGSRNLWLINGDAARNGRGMFQRSRTPDHQRNVRDWIRASGFPFAVIPFSALTGAAINPDSVRIIHTRPDAEWTETRTVRTLAEMPRWAQTETYSVDCSARKLEPGPGDTTYDAVPADRRELWRQATPDEIAAGVAAGCQYLPLLPDPDGLYRWKESRTRTVKPGPDGLYRWETRLHRLGDCLFSGVRAETFERPAHAFETARETTRETVEIIARDPGRLLGTGPDAPRASAFTRGYCTADDVAVCEAGPSGACIHCEAPLIARVTVRARGRYLSSFDLNEPVPLYFLAQVPRGAGATVENALDALAPAAVHAATARGKDVRRQGDIFFIDTPLTREDLAARGAVFARLTLWTMSARPRKGEPDYKPAPGRKVLRRERNYARRLWRAGFREDLARLTVSHIPRAGRETNRARWADLLERHSLELAAAAGADLETALSGPCETCGAPAGAACETVTAPDVDSPHIVRIFERLEYDRETSGYHPKRAAIGPRHRRELADLRRETHARPVKVAAPTTAAGARKRYRRRRAETAAAVETARAKLNRLLATPARNEPRPGRHTGRYYYGTASSVIREARADYAVSVRNARAELERAIANAELARWESHRARDEYRTLGANRAVLRMIGAREDARRKYRPDHYDTATIGARRERARRILAVYGTAHTATECARVNGAVYVRGVVRHVPELEPGRGGTADHRPLTLTDGHWYLAVRNRVPRQSLARTRRAPRRPVAGSNER